MPLEMSVQVLADQRQPGSVPRGPRGRRADLTAGAELPDQDDDAQHAVALVADVRRCRRPGIQLGDSQEGSHMNHHEHDLALEGKRAAVAVGPLFEEIEALYPLYRLRE